MFTNINIIDNEHVFNYIIEYDRSSLITRVNSEHELHYMMGDMKDDVYLCLGEDVYRRNENVWYKLDNEYNYDHLPQHYKVCNMSLYFPDYSVDCLTPGISYSLSISLKIGSKIIHLGSTIINRIDALACDRVKTFMNQHYYEMHTIQIIDPYELMYADEWDEFRKNICGEVVNSNNEGSVIYVSLHPIQSIENLYIKHDSYVGGQNSIVLSKDSSDFLNLNIYSNTNKILYNNEEPSVVCELQFNKHYNNDLQLYIKETYGFNCEKLKYELMIGNEDEIYAIIEGDDSNDNIYKFTKHTILEKSGNFQNGQGWKEGIFIMGSVSLYDENGEEIIYLVSNKIPLTIDIFKYFVGGDFEIKGRAINNVNIESVDMNILNINTINKIENKIIRLSNIDDAKNGIIQPIFFRVTETSNIIVHRGVTENICINLDDYKSKVESFYLQIDGVDFKEIGRTPAGVIFKVFGKNLPRESTSSTYYILNQDSELVTSGKYMYAQ